MSVEGDGNLRAKLRTTWDEVYRKSGYNPTEFKREKHEAYYSTLVELGFFQNIPENAVIVQGGCGHGSAVRLMSDMEEHDKIFPIGVDLSHKPLTTARAVNNISAIEGDVSALPFNSGSVHGFFEVGVVEHFYRENHQKKAIVDRPLIVHSFLEILRVLEHGSKAAFIQPSYRSMGRIEHRLRDVIGLWDMGFQEDFLLEDFTQLMEIAGFTNIDYRIIQAPRDLPKYIRVADNIFRQFLEYLGRYDMANGIGMFFIVVGEKA